MLRNYLSSPAVSDLYFCVTMRSPQLFFCRRLHSDHQQQKRRSLGSFSPLPTAIHPTVIPAPAPTRSQYEVLGDAASRIEVRAWIRNVEVERAAREQLLRLSYMDTSVVAHPVAVMPDVHSGIGCTVGLVLPTVRAIIPASVGVDIGCGMIAVQTSLVAEDLPPSLEELRLAVESRVPHGRTHAGRCEVDAGGWRGAVPVSIQKTWKEHLDRDFQELCDLQPILAKTNHLNHLGTLGTGNHFIEICLDDSHPYRRVWVMLHSGSRGVGNRIGSLFIDIAKKDMGTLLSNLPDANLAYLKEGTSHFSNYVRAVDWAQRYAYWNRQLMLEMVLEAMRACVQVPFTTTSTAINCHHNYVERCLIPHRDAMENKKEIWLTRKGATSAKKGELAVIPGSMGAKSYIVRGKGNEDSYCSCSHGAGRRYSRGESKRRFTVEDHEKATQGIECRKDSDVLDETPGAYKDIDAVIQAQTDLVDVVAVLQQVLCVKG